MEGFTDGIPFQVAVSWLKNADGTPIAVPLLNAQPFPEGLLAETIDGTTQVVTRWFVPWSAVVYIKQDQVAPPPTQPTNPPPAPKPPPADLGLHGK